MSHHRVREWEEHGFQFGVGLDGGAAALAAEAGPKPPNGEFGSSW